MCQRSSSVRVSIGGNRPRWVGLRPRSRCAVRPHLAITPEPGSNSKLMWPDVRGLGTGIITLHQVVQVMVQTIVVIPLHEVLDHGLPVEGKILQYISGCRDHLLEVVVGERSVAFASEGPSGSASVSKLAKMKPFHNSVLNAGSRISDRVRSSRCDISGTPTSQPSRP